MALNVMSTELQQSVRKLCKCLWPTLNATFTNFMINSMILSHHHPLIQLPFTSHVCVCVCNGFFTRNILIRGSFYLHFYYDSLQTNENNDNLNALERRPSKSTEYSYCNVATMNSNWLTKMWKTRMDVKLRPIVVLPVCLSARLSVCPDWA